MASNHFLNLVNFGLSQIPTFNNLEISNLSQLVIDSNEHSLIVLLNLLPLNLEFGCIGIKIPRNKSRQRWRSRSPSWWIGRKEITALTRWRKQFEELCYSHASNGSSISAALAVLALNFKGVGIWISSPWRCTIFVWLPTPVGSFYLRIALR